MGAINRAPSSYSPVDYLKVWFSDEGRQERTRAAGGRSMFTLNRGKFGAKYEPPSPAHDRCTPLAFLPSESDLDFRHDLYLFITKAATQDELNEIKSLGLEAMVQGHSLWLAVDNANSPVKK